MTTTLNMVKPGKYANGKCHQINQVQVFPTTYRQSPSNSGTFCPLPCSLCLSLFPLLSAHVSYAFM